MTQGTETKEDILRWANSLYEVGKEIKEKTPDRMTCSMLLSLALSLLDFAEEEDVEELRERETQSSKIDDELKGLIEAIREPNENL